MFVMFNAFKANHVPGLLRPLRCLHLLPLRLDHVSGPGAVGLRGISFVSDTRFGTLWFGYHMFQFIGVKSIQGRRPIAYGFDCKVLGKQSLARGAHETRPHGSIWVARLCLELVPLFLWFEREMPRQTTILGGPLKRHSFRTCWQLLHCVLLNCVKLVKLPNGTQLGLCTVQTVG